MPTKTTKPNAANLADEVVAHGNDAGTDAGHNPRDLFRGNGGGMRLRALNTFMVILAAVVALIFLQGVHEANDAYTSLEQASEKYIACESAVSEMKAGSNYLTNQVRSFVVTQNPEYLENYFHEADVDRRRERAVETLESLQSDNSSMYLKQAMADSSALMKYELHAMRLVCEARGLKDEVQAHLSDVILDAQEVALSPDQKIALAREIVFGDEYVDYVADIEDDAARCKSALVDDIGSVQDASQTTLHAMLLRQEVLAIMLFGVFIAMVVCIAVTVQWPLRSYSSHIQDNDSLPNTGAAELREMAQSYNEMYYETMKSQDILRRKAEHDHLTGLYNRSVFERLLQLHVDDNYAIMIVDADYFKDVNDKLGHDVGDAVLQKIANLLSGAFRTTDYPCRIGGDEFVVFMTDMTQDLRYVVENKAKSVMEGLRDTSDGLPVVTVSIGVAFSDGELSGEQVFKCADKALYDVKEAGRNGYGFYEGE